MNWGSDDSHWGPNYWSLVVSKGSSAARDIKVGRLFFLPFGPHSKVWYHWSPSLSATLRKKQCLKLCISRCQTHVKRLGVTGRGWTWVGVFGHVWDWGPWKVLCRGQNPKRFYGPGQYYDWAWLLMVGWSAIWAYHRPRSKVLTYVVTKPRGYHNIHPCPERCDWIIFALLAFLLAILGTFFWHSSSFLSIFPSILPIFDYFCQFF